MAPRFAEDVILAACRDGDPEAIGDLCDSILVSLRQRSGTGPSPVRGHSQIPDSDVSNFVYRMIKACHKRSIPPPAELVELLQVHLSQDRPPAGRGERSVQRAEAIRYREANPKASLRAIARAVGVSPSTITEWKRAGVFGK